MEEIDSHDAALSSSSDESDVEEEEEDFSDVLNEIADLEKTLRDNPFAYDSHVALVRARVRVGHIGKLRGSFEKFSEIFPLTEELWQSWIDAEVKQAEDREDLVYITSIFARATKDYLSVPLWMSYCQFLSEMASEIGDPETVNARIRSVFEEALMAGGLHVQLGAQLWEAYRDFEMACIQSLETKQEDATPGSAQQVSLSKEIDAAKQRVHSLFRRQLSVPLKDLEECVSDYEEFSLAPLPAQLQHTYKKALAELETLQKYEDALVAADAPRLQEYKDYIAFEAERGSPPRIQCLYERALADNCLQFDLWYQYGIWLDTKLMDGPTCLSVHQRACRNCPWVVSLWRARLLAMERHSQQQLTIDGVFESAKQAGFLAAADYLLLWKTYCDFKLRSVDEGEGKAETVKDFRSTVDSAVEYMNQKFGDEGDPTCFLLKYLARVEVEVLSNFHGAQKIWQSRILVRGRGNSSVLWLEYAALARAHGGKETCRKVLYQAVQCATDDSNTVCQALLDFEAERGSLCQWDDAQARCSAQLARLEERQAKAGEKAALAEAKQKETRQSSRAEKRQQKKGDRQQGQAKPDTPIKLPQKRRASPLEEDSSGKGPQILPPRKKALTPGSTSEDGFQVPLLPSSYETSDRKQPVASVAEPSSAGSPTLTRHDKIVALSEEGMDTSLPSEEPAPLKFEFDPKNMNRTVFVSNLKHYVQEASLREAFGEHGTISDVRIVRKRTGQNTNCYAYVEYTDELPVQAALKLDRKMLIGRPMFVSACFNKDEDAQPPRSKYSKSLDCKTLFVTGLPFELREEEITKLFSEHGTVKDVRLVMRRPGFSKGFCYVAMEEEVHATRCVVRLDRHVINGRTIGVALSHPPKKDGDGVGSSSHGGQSRGGAGQSRGGYRGGADRSRQYGSSGHDDLPRMPAGGRGRSFSRTTLLPRSVRGSKAVANTESKAEDGNGSSSSSNSATPSKPMSNSDFRAMLLKQ